jgi:von Willebrand factor type A domain
MSELASGAPTVRGEVHQNLYLAAGTSEVQALITVDSVGADGAGPPVSPEAAEVIILDESVSMGSPQLKMRCALDAAAAAIDELRDGVLFAVVAGSHEARVVFPRWEGMVRAGERTRRHAKAALAGVAPTGGTAIGRWLGLAGTLLAAHPDAIRHAILLTDGRDEHETADDLAVAVANCAGLFSCDCRGIGDDWSAPELRRVARGLLGSFDKIAEPAAMAGDFAAMMAASMRKEVAQVGLRVWTPVGASVRLVKQAAPDPVDLTDRRLPGPNDQLGIYPTGAWGTEQRDFHLAVEVPPGAVHQERLACRVELVQLLPDGRERPLEQCFVRTRPGGDRESHPRAMVSAIWTDDPERNTGPHPRVVLSHDQGALEQAVDVALAAFESGDDPRAEEWLDAARDIAQRAEMHAVVARIDEMRDPVTGTYQLTPPDMIDIGVESSKQAPWRDRSPAGRAERA